MKRLLAVTMFVFLFPILAQAAEAPRCSTYGADVVGPFMKDTCRVCYDEGVCTLADVMVVLGNVAQFIFGIVGSLALLLFVVGGIYWLTSRGEKEGIQKGRQYFWAATVGLVISFSAYLILNTVVNVLTSGAPGSAPGGIACDGTNNGVVCGENSECYAGQCQDLCAITNLQARETDPLAGYSCVDPAAYASFPGACVPNRCGEDTTVSCCDANYLQLFAPSAP
ncbi:hypothetical protein HYW18_00520 [Candidatus Uhrbacteria bacterium]|nr:hypothetical protein [Candidatus Uhrbacteria bacterium]